MSPNLIAAMLGALATTLGAAVVLIGRKLANIRIEAFHADIDHGDNLEADCRINDVAKELKRQESVSTWYWRAHALLTFSQYVVGGVLATSFVQSSLSNDTVGLLGIIVLTSKLIHQQYRPDSSYERARHRATLLRQLIRDAEDHLYGRKENVREKPAIYSIRRMISERLAKIEDINLMEK